MPSLVDVGKSIRQDGLRHGLQTSSAGSLQYSKEKKKTKVGSHTAEKRAHRKDGKAAHEKSLAAKSHRDPAADGKDDGVRDKI